MTRPLRGEEHVSTEEFLGDGPEPQTIKDWRRRQIAWHEMKPYEGKDSLPAPVKDAEGRVIIPGEPRFFTNYQNGKYELIGVYRSTSVKRVHWKTLTPTKDTHKPILEALKKRKILGAYL